jgi:Uma2 family endonuclease
MALEAPIAPTQEALLDRWRDIISEYPELFEDAAERIETDAFGNILMSPPPDGVHQKRELRIATLLETLLPGDGTVPERAVLTDLGVKVPDVIWLAAHRAHEIEGTQPLTPAPEICIEVRSPGNTIQELYEKRDAYLRAGAREVWVCDLSNRMTFFDKSGELNKSKLCPDFPPVIEVYRKSQQARQGQ